MMDESTAAAKAAALLGQDNTLQDDSDVMLTNVEEMLEGLEWGAVAHGHSADQLEKRLMGELNALEAAGIHAIIESDDRVNDVIRYLDNALADLDKMDLMISLYKTHLNVSTKSPQRAHDPCVFCANLALTGRIGRHKSHRISESRTATAIKQSKSITS